MSDYIQNVQQLEISLTILSSNFVFEIIFGFFWPNKKEFLQLKLKSSFCLGFTVKLFLPILVPSI